jgi:4-hydroxy-2-oxoheptanedioate aldolase
MRVRNVAPERLQRREMSMGIGIPGDFGHETIAGAYEAVLAACRKHGKWRGMAGVYVEELMRKYIGMGMRLVLSGSDGAFLMAGASHRAALVREWGEKA